MAKNKDELKKEQLIHETKVNKKPPVWVYLKTKDKSKMRERTRHWRSGNVGKKNKHKVKDSEEGKR